MKNKYSHLMCKITDGISMMGIMSIVLVMGLAVFMRYVMSAPLQWVEELLITIFIWSLMLGAVSAMRTRSHVSIDVLVSCLPLPVQKYIQIFNHVVVIITLGLLGWFGLELTLGVMDKFTPILKIPYEVIDSAVFTGSLLMVLYAVGHLIRDLQALGKPSGGVGIDGGQE